MLWERLHRQLTLTALQGGLEQAAREGRRTQAKREGADVAATARLLYVPYMCQPYQINGYTARTHALLKALHAVADVRVLTRTGYPWDMPAAAAPCPAPWGDEIFTAWDGVRYDHLPRPKNNIFTAIYARQAAVHIAAYAARHRVTCIHAASNHVNALPALLAARRLGIPFHYEMRGLWELSRASREKGYENSHGYRLGLELEGWTAQHAEQVFVISEQLGRFAQENWGITAEKIQLLPNCVDAERIAPREDISTLPDTIGYAGALAEYEGLDVLLHAVALLRGQGRAVRVHIIGDGDAKAALERLAGQLHVQDAVTFFGKLSPEAARNALAQCSLVCLPRKPYAVCNIVPPLKLVEAMAMEKAVVVPDLPVFRDELRQAGCGLFFTAGDAAHLAEVLAGALNAPQHMRAVGKQGRDYVVRHRQWKYFIHALVNMA